MGCDSAPSAPTGRALLPGVQAEVRLLPQEAQETREYSQPGLQGTAASSSPGLQQELQQEPHTASTV